MIRIFAIVLAVTCLATPFDDAFAGKRGSRSVDLDPTSRGSVSGVGIESRDIDSMADQVLRELMSRPDLVGSQVPPRVVVDSEKFTNNSAQRIK